MLITFLAYMGSGTMGQAHNYVRLDEPASWLEYLEQESPVIFWARYISFLYGATARRTIEASRRQLEKYALT